MCSKIPEIDGLLGSNGFEQIPELLDQLYHPEGQFKQFLQKKPHYRQYQQQERIQSTPSHYAYLKIAEGCSGVRSLIALVFVASVYGYVTQNKIWKFVIMVMSSLPLAIIANSIRVTTIVLIAEFWDAEFAARTYHNFSGFLFFPLGIIGIILIGFLLNSGWKSKQKVISRQLVSGKESKGKDTEKIKGDDT